MSKGIRSYPESQRALVVARRMRQYNPKGTNGLGTLAAKAQYDREQSKIQTAVNKLSKKNGAEPIEEEAVNA